MRILILANNDVGLYKFRKELISRLLVNDEVYISLPDGEMILSLVNLGCKFMDTGINCRGTNPFTNLKLIKQYAKIIKQVKTQKVIT